MTRARIGSDGVLQQESQLGLPKCCAWRSTLSWCRRTEVVALLVPFATLAGTIARALLAERTSSDTTVSDAGVVGAMIAGIAGAVGSLHRPARIGGLWAVVGFVADVVAVGVVAGGRRWHRHDGQAQTALRALG